MVEVHQLAPLNVPTSLLNDHWQEKGDTIAQWVTGYSMVSVLFHRIVPPIRNLFGLNLDRRHLQSSSAFRGAGFLGMIGLTWNCFRAGGRLIDGRYRDEAEERKDWLLLAGGAFAVLNISVGLLRGMVFKDIMTRGLAFSDHLDRMNKMQGGLVGIGMAVDGWGLLELFRDWQRDPEPAKAYEFVVQAGLTAVFGFDRQSRQVLGGLVKDKSIESQVGRDIGRAIASSRIKGIRHVKSNPYYIAAMIGEKLGLPPSHTYPIAAQYTVSGPEGAGTARLAEEACRKLIAEAKIFKVVDDGRHLISHLHVDELMLSILRHSRNPRVDIRMQDVRLAQDQILAGHLQHFMETKLRPLAVADNRRVGPEIEFEPPRHDTEEISAAESFSGLVERRPLSRTEILRQMHDDLVADGWKDRGWKVDLVKPDPIDTGPSSYVYPSQVIAFTYGEVHYQIYNYQGTGNNILHAWANGQPILDIPLKFPGGVMDEPSLVLNRLKGNYEAALDWIATDLAKKAKPKKGSKPPTRREIRQGMDKAIEEQKGSRNICCIVKASGIQRWSWNPATGKIQFDSIRPRTGLDGDEARQLLSRTFDNFGDAYRTFRELSLAGRLKLESVEEQIFLRISKGRPLEGGKELTLEMSLEANIDLEFCIHNMTAGEDDDQFLLSACKTLKKLGARGVGGGHQVAQQLHVQVDHEGNNVGPLVKGMRGFYRLLPLYARGVPPRENRLTQIQPARWADEHYKGRAPDIEQKRRDAIDEIIGDAWDRSPEENDSEWRARVVQRILEITDEHSSTLNADGITRHLVQSAYKIESPRYRGVPLGTPAPVPFSVRPGTPSGRWQIQEVPLEDLTPLQRQTEADWQALLQMTRSLHNPPLPTLEARLLNAPGKDALDADGVLFNHRVLTGLLYAAQNGLLETQNPMARHLLREQHRFTDEDLEMLDYLLMRADQTLHDFLEGAPLFYSQREDLPVSMKTLRMH